MTREDWIVTWIYIFSMVFVAIIIRIISILIDYHKACKKNDKIEEEEEEFKKKYGDWGD